MVIRRAALAKVISHCEEECRGEQCGVLVGEPYLDDTGLYLEIDDAIEGRFSDSRHRRVTFTHTTWQYIQKRIDADYPEKRIVGWYHTHPGFGTFLSEEDIFIYRNFFRAPWQVALVVDPLKKDIRFFFWDRERIDSTSKAWVDGQYRELSPLPIPGSQADAPARPMEKFQEVLTGLTNVTEILLRLRSQLRILLWALGALIAAVVVTALLLFLFR
jgi:proteasome lid subunit RPN8/RPN11